MNEKMKGKKKEVSAWLHFVFLLTSLLGKALKEIKKKELINQAPGKSPSGGVFHQVKAKLFLGLGPLQVLE